MYVCMHIRIQRRNSIELLSSTSYIYIFVLQCGSEIGSYASSGSPVYNFHAQVILNLLHVSVGGSTHTCTFCTMTLQSHVLFQLLLKLLKEYLLCTFGNVRHR